MQFKGKVLRSLVPKLIEVKRKLHCRKCRNDIDLEANYEQCYVFQPMKSCPNTNCKGVPYQKQSEEVILENCINYQEILVQPVGKSSPGSRNGSALTVTMENELVDICCPGDTVIIW